MLDPRLYRVAFVPVLLALLVAAFSLQDRPRAIGTTLVPEAFESVRAMQTLDELARDYPVRRPGDDADTRLAGEIARRMRELVPGTVEEHRYRGDTIDGRRDLVDVVATRPGVPGPGLVVVAHRDAAGRSARAELSATAALLELARVAADGRLRRTITFISTSGGSGGFAGAQEEGGRLGGRADAVLVLGDVASPRGRRPFVVGFSNGKGQAPLQLRRTLEAAVRREAGTDAGGARALVQMARMAVPVTISEQGPFLRAGQPAVLLSASGERPPAADAAVSDGRMLSFGRASLRVLYALDNFRDYAAPPTTDLVVRGKVLPGWAVRLVVGALLLPPLVLCIDAMARLRRRREPAGRWAAWALSAGVPLIVGCALAVLLAAVGLIEVAPGAPIPPEALEVGAGPIAALAVLVLVVVLSFLVLRPAALRAVGMGDVGIATAGAPGAVVGTALAAAVTAVALWIANPYAALLVVPAVHLWPWATTPDLRIPRPVSLLLVVLGLTPLVLVAVLDGRAFGLGIGEALWFWPLLVAGGHVPVGSWVLWSLFWGTALSAAIVAVRRPKVQGEAEGEVTVRGPVRYAGPGSLGGTESALRR